MSREFLRNNNGSAFTNLCNSTVIEIYGDIIRVSHGFDGCQMFEYIADSTTGDQGAGNDDITTFLMPFRVHRCWR
jgi:hypothetical protein